MLVLLFGIEKSFQSALILLLTPIYHCVAFVFKIFIILATGKLLNDDAYGILLTNFYVILGIILLFFIAFSLLKAMTNPDDLSKTTTTTKKIVVNLVTSGIIMALLPTIFTFLFDIQSAVIVDYNVIGRFFGYGSSRNETYEEGSSSIRNIEVASYTLANGVWTAFFNVNTDSEDCIDAYETYEVGSIESCPAGTECEKLRVCQDTITAGDKYNFPDGGDILKKNNGDVEGYNDKHSFTTTMKYIENTGSFGAYRAFAEQVVDDEIDFNFVLALVAGLLMLYVGVSYCFDMAVRLVKLVFYQLIAPIPIFLRVVPEGKASGMFNQWMKITLSCYFEVYTRIFIFYFVIYLCNKMLETDFLSFEIYEYGFWTGLFTQAFIIMGLITFMKQAPKLISEITGIDTGNMKLGIKDKLAAGGAFTAGAVLGGGVTTVARNISNTARNWKNSSGKERASMLGGILTGGVSGAVRSGRAGWGARSAADMRNASSRGAQGAVDARDRRDARSDRYQATGNNWFTRSAVGGHIMDVGSSALDWATGGAARFQQAMDTSNKFGQLNSAMKASADKVVKKFRNNSELIKTGGANAQGFKGNAAQQAAQKAMFNKLIGLNGGKQFNLAQLDSYIEQQSAEIDKSRFSSTVATGMVGSDGKPITKTVFDEKAYQAAQMAQAQEVATLNQMKTQLEKNAQSIVINESQNYGTYGLGIEEKEFADVKADAENYINAYTLNGATVTDPVTGDEFGSVSKSGDVAKQLKDISDAYEHIGSDARAQKAKYDQQQQAKKEGK